MTVVNEDTWQYCINCISWSKQSCIFDIIGFPAVRMHVTNMFFCKSVWKTRKLWIWKDINSVPFYVWRHKPNNLIFSSFESSWSNLLDKFAFVDFRIAFIIDSLRIDEWWISSQNQNLANLFSDVQSTNSILSRGQTNTFSAWTLAILVLKVL